MRPILVLVGVAVVCVGVALLVPLLAAQPAIHDGPDVHAWEYKAMDLRSMVDLSRDTDEVFAQFEKELNKLGSEGWEVCLDLPGVLVLKRPK